MPPSMMKKALPPRLVPVACMKMHDDAAGHAGSVPSSGSLERAPSAILLPSGRLSAAFVEDGEPSSSSALSSKDRVPRTS